MQFPVDFSLAIVELGCSSALSVLQSENLFPRGRRTWGQDLLFKQIKEGMLKASDSGNKRKRLGREALHVTSGEERPNLLA